MAKELERLGDSFHIINDFHLLGQRGNFDHIVLGLNGIFMIETKNHKGSISCNGDVWKQRKVGQLGTVYDGVLKNPSLQVKANAAILNDFIKQRLNKNIWINPIIVFTNEEAELHIKNSTVPILRPEKLHEFITNYQSKRHLSSQELLGIKNILNIQV
ncbi:MAG: NERD domain-containing protein [Candidatus Peribacteraceae bacterium]|nr:NERD domain-containing protein [Candidatus Peribacteraceae bacterium]